MCPAFTPRQPAPLPDYTPPAWLSWLVLAGLLIVPASFGVWLWRNPLPARRASALMGMLGGGALIIVIGLIEISGDEEFWRWLAAVAALGLVAGSVGLGRLGKLGRLAWLGLALMAVGGLMIGLGVIAHWLKYEGMWWLTIFGLPGHALGLMLFGVHSLRARPLPRFNFLPLGMGVLGGLLPLVVNFITPINANWYFATALGGGWLVLGGVFLNFPAQLGAHPHDNERISI